MNALHHDSSPVAPPPAQEAEKHTPLSLTAIRGLRTVAALEGVSYLALLGVAMPLKYFAGMPMAVRVTGTAHGVLFLLYVAAVCFAGVLRRWPVRKWGLNLVASLLPFGPFLADPALRREQEEITRA